MRAIQPGAVLPVANWSLPRRRWIESSQDTVVNPLQTRGIEVQDSGTDSTEVRRWWCR
jgi:hypothetical protein